MTPVPEKTETARWTILAATAWVTGLMVSPEVLAILGGIAGRAGFTFAGLLVVALVFHLINAEMYVRLGTDYPEPGGEARLIREALGPLPALTVPLCARAGLAVFIATGMLFSADVIFNEVLFSGFPPYTVAFSLLGLVVLINVMGHDMAEKGQVLFVGVAMAGLLLLSLAGLIRGGWSGTIGEGTDMGMNGSIAVTAHLLLLFVGFDNLIFTRSRFLRAQENPLVYIGIGMVTAAILFCLWGLASLLNISTVVLAETHAPHLLAARTILGATGGVIMGGVVLAGVCAGINAVFAATARMMVGMAEEELLPRGFRQGGNRAPVPFLVLAAVTGLFMVTGLGGSTALDTLIRAGFMLWLLNYGVVHLSAWIIRKRPYGGVEGAVAKGHPVFYLFGTTVMLTGVTVLLWTAPRPVFLLASMVLTLAVVWIAGMLWLRVPFRR